MKKTLCLILAIILALSLVACGNSSSNTTNNTNSQSSEESIEQLAVLQLYLALKERKLIMDGQKMTGLLNENVDAGHCSYKITSKTNSGFYYVKGLVYLKNEYDRSVGCNYGDKGSSTLYFVIQINKATFDAKCVHLYDKQPSIY